MIDFCWKSQVLAVKQLYTDLLFLFLFTNKYNKQIHLKNLKNLNQIECDTNMNYDECMKSKSKCKI